MEGFGFCGVSLRFGVAKFPERTPDQCGVLDADQSNALFTTSVRSQGGCAAGFADNFFQRLLSSLTRLFP